jgi:DNA-directed RNA polymerase specialized sigma24 family protein
VSNIRVAVLLEIPLAYYQGFIGRCELESREYQVLRNAIIGHAPEYLRDGNVTTLLCSEDDAKILLRRATQFYPIAASYIEEALRSLAYDKTNLGDTWHSTPPTTKTLGDILFADKSKVRLSEDEWLQLVRGVGRGDQQALHSLYQQTHRIVFTLVVRLTANQETAEEVTLDVFCDVWRKAASYDPADGSVAGWIMNQARSRTIDRLRLDHVARSLVGGSTDVLRPAESLWGRLANRIAGETATRPFVPPLEAAVEPEWEEAAPGIHVQILARNSENDRVSMLVRLDPGTDYPGHTHAGIEELHLLHGVLKVDDRTLHPGDFIHSEAGSVDHRVWSETGCTCFLVTSTKDVLF